MPSNTKKFVWFSDTKGNVLDLAEGFYQISLILVAISLVSCTAILWVLSMTMGSIGIITNLNALFFY
jgi:hypothetical protein